MESFGVFFWGGFGENLGLINCCNINIVIVSFIIIKLALWAFLFLEPLLYAQKSLFMTHASPKNIPKTIRIDAFLP